MSAETWLGALAWAAGSQKCRGTMPAFMPNPKTASRNTTDIAGDGATVWISNEPVPAFRSANAAKSPAVPACVATRYTHAARRTSARASSVATRKNAETAISSHARRKSTMCAAVTTSARPIVMRA